MPAESERLRRRIARRDRWFLGLVAAALIAAAAVGLVVAQHGPGRAGHERCVDYSHPNFTGGATYTYCGAAAAAFCRRSAAAHPGVLAQCERLGLVPRRG